MLNIIVVFRVSKQDNCKNVIMGFEIYKQKTMQVV